MDVLVLGRTEVLYEAAELIAGRHRVVGIVTAPAAPEYKRTERDFENLARRLGCPFLLTHRVDGILLDFIRDAGAQIAVSSHWVANLGADVFALLPQGILNAHHGDLPRYRGNAATNWMVLRHERRVHATIHFMEPGELDAGDIVARRAMELSEDTTIGQIFDFIERNIPAMFVDILDRISQGTLSRIPQHDAGATPFRCYPRLPAHSRIDWTQPAREIHALVRASSRPFSGAYSYLKLDAAVRRLTVWKSRVVAEQSDDIGMPGHVIRNDNATGESWIYTGRGILALQRVQLDGGDAFMPGKVWKSIRIGFGIDVEAELIELQRKLSEGR